MSAVHSLYSTYNLQANFAFTNKLFVVSKNEDDTKRQKKGFNHLKWPAIAIIILILLLIIFLDHLYRQGNI